MKLFTKTQMAKLLKNGSPEQRGKDHAPVVKLFTPDAQCTWLLTDIDPENHDTAFGLCDLGLGFPELAYVSLSELSAIRGGLGLPIERDRHFEAKYPMSVYANAARAAQRIVTHDAKLLAQIANARKEG